jgi:Tol biopolymer transport system component
MRTSSGGTPERLPLGEDGQTPTVSRPLEDGTRRLAYVRNYVDINIWRVETTAAGAPASSPPVLAVASTRVDVLPHLSPDGRRITFISNRSGESEVWVSDTSGGNAVQLTSLGANPGYPRFSPDGQFVVFHTNVEDRPTGDVYAVPAGGGKVRNLTMHAANDVFASYSRDGKWIYFCSHRSGEPFIWKMPVSGGDPVKLSLTPSMYAAEAADGQSVFYVESSQINRPGPLWQLPLNGGSPTKLVDGAMPNSLEVIDSGLYYLDPADGYRLQFLNFATRRSATVASNLGPSVSGTLGVSRDGRTIYFSRVDSTIDDLMLVERFR